MTDTVDRALDRLHLSDLEYATARADGLASHGPMVVASLAEIGQIDCIEPFVEAYAKRLRPMPARIDVAPRLGDPAARTAWIAHYERRLIEADDWRPVARAELRELLPGAVAGAAHGWLRTAHAIDMLTARDTETRRRELAFGLASWAARFQRLPGAPGAHPTRGLDVAAALGRVPVVAASRRSRAPRILDQVDVVGELDGFAEAVESVDLDALPIDAAIGALVAACARLFLASPEGQFAYLHTITATSALRLVAGVLDDATMRTALGAVFQVVAALHATNSGPPITVALRSAASRDRILAAAIEALDDHDVKLAVAALREDALAPQSEVLAVAATWLNLA
jgi:Questin oxidase-like